MTVKELKELLVDAPDDLPVMVIVENHLKPGMFAFAEACEGETGIGQIGIGDDEGKDVFLIMPHGVGVSEEELENGEGNTHGLN